MNALWMHNPVMSSTWPPSLHSDGRGDVVVTTSTSSLCSDEVDVITTTPNQSLHSEEVDIVVTISTSSLCSD